MPLLFKDFNKDVKDLLTKNYQIGAWKLESKLKCPSRQLCVAPNLDKSKFSVDVLLNDKESGVSTKTSWFTDDRVEEKITYEGFGNKVEVTLKQAEAEKADAKADTKADASAKQTDASKSTGIQYEITDEFNAAPFGIYAKVTNNDAEANVSFTQKIGAFEALLGGGASYSIKKSSLSSWSAGVRVTDGTYTANVTAKNLKEFTTGVLATLPFKISDKKVTVAGQVICGGEKKKFEGTIGAEFTCPLGTGTLFRAKVDESGLATVAAIRSIGSGWKGAFSVVASAKPRFGFYLVNE